MIIQPTVFGILKSGLNVYQFKIYIMAKEDFCFTYYDGDAARDKAHMNRLERGGYEDLITSQRKFGHLSLLLIKKTLGGDFEDIWEALEIILKKDEEGKYFVEWLENSIIKMKKQSVHQSENGSKGGRPKKAAENPNETQPITQTPNKKKPLENEDGNEDEDENRNINEYKGGAGEKKCESMIPRMAAEFKRFNTEYPDDAEKDYPALMKIALFIGKKIEKPFIVNEDFESSMMPYWSQLCQKIPNDKFYRDKSLTTIERNIQSIILTIQDESGSNTNGKSNSKITADGLNKAHAKYFG